MLQYSGSVAIPHGAPILERAGEPVPFLNMGKGFMQTNRIATVIGDAHLCMWRRTFDGPQKKQIGKQCDK